MIVYMQQKTFSVTDSQESIITNIIVDGLDEIFDNGNDWSLRDYYGDGVFNFFKREKDYIAVISDNPESFVSEELISKANQKTHNALTTQEETLIKKVYEWLNSYVKSNYSKIKEQSKGSLNSYSYSDLYKAVLFTTSQTKSIIISVRTLVKEFIKKYGSLIPKESILEFITPFEYLKYEYKKDYMEKWEKEIGENAIKSFKEKYKRK